MHYRREIRRRMADRLITGIPIKGTDPVQYMTLDVGGRVHVQRVVAVENDEFPLALIHFGADPVTAHNSAKSNRDRAVVVNVDLIQLMRENIEDELDRLEWQTSIILCSDFPPALGLDNVHSIELASTLPYNPDVDGEQKRGFTRMVFTVNYWEDIYTPGTLDEFLSFGEEIATPSGAVSEFDKTIRSS